LTKQQAIKLLSKNTGINEISKLRNKGFSQREIIDTIQEAIDMCIASTEKQIAKKPVGEWYLHSCCVCNEVVDELGSKYRFSYCPNCGQKQNWSAFDILAD
jgi:hypothetical protein